MTELTNEQMDAAIAERVMGWRWVMWQNYNDEWCRTLYPQWKPIGDLEVWDGREAVSSWSRLFGFEPSVDLSAASDAMGVLCAKFAERGWEFDPIISMTEDGSWEIELNTPTGCIRVSFASLSALPAAICKCLLEAVDALEGKNDG